MGYKKRKVKATPQEMLALWNEGKSYKEIGDYFGLSANWVSKKLHECDGFEPRSTKVYFIDLFELCKYIESGRTTHEAAFHFNVPTHYIYNVLQHNGIQLYKLRKKLDFDKITADYVKNRGSYVEIAVNLDMNETTLKMRLKLKEYDLDELYRKRTKFAMNQTDKRILLNAEFHPNRMHIIKCAGCKARRFCDDCWYKKLYFG